MTGLEQERAVFDIFANEEFTALLDKEPTEFEEFMVKQLRQYPNPFWVRDFTPLHR